MVHWLPQVQEVVVVATDGPVFVLLRANSPRQRLLPDKHSDGCVTVQLRQLLFGHLKEAYLLDKNGQMFRVLDASFKRIDFGAYRPLGIFWGVVTSFIGILTLTCFVKVTVRMEHTRTLSLEQAKAWLVELVNKSPHMYQHARQEDLITKISKAKGLNSLITGWYFD